MEQHTACRRHLCFAELCGRLDLQHAGTVGAGGTVVCNVAALASASSGSFTLVARVASTTPGATVLTNVVNASSATSDSTPGNNSATTTTTVCSGD